MISNKIKIEEVHNIFFGIFLYLGFLKILVNSLFNSSFADKMD